MTVAPPGTADVVSEHPLDRALDHLQLSGAIFFRAEFTEAWSCAAPATEGDVARALEPSAERLIMFHIVAAGTCWVAGPDGERHAASAGDVIVLPYGDAYVMGGNTSAATVPIFTLLAPPPWATMPILRHGNGGPRTDIVCGYLNSNDPLFDPRLRAFPPVLVVRPPEPAARWVRSSVEYALAISAGEIPSDPTSTRLPRAVVDRDAAAAPRLGSRRRRRAGCRRSAIPRRPGARVPARPPRATVDRGAARP